MLSGVEENEDEQNGDKVVRTNKKTGEREMRPLSIRVLRDSGWGGCSVEHTVKYNDGTTEATPRQ